MKFKGKASALPDAKIIDLGKTLRDQIEAEYALWLKTHKGSAQLQKLESATHRLEKSDDWYDKVVKIRKRFKHSRAGRKHAAAYEAFNSAAENNQKLAVEIQRLKPTTLTGCAVFALAALYSELDGWSCKAGYDGARITSALCRAARFRIPTPVRRTMRVPEPYSVLLE
jgi:hypothetical protein